jgi:tetratricopeptide (TPR) repeat protein
VQADDADSNHVARAENYAAAAFDAYTRGQYGVAVVLYTNALEVAPSPDLVYNLARIYDTKLKDRAHAIEYYGRYAQEPGAESERLQVATERLLALREEEQREARAKVPDILPPRAARRPELDAVAPLPDVRSGYGTANTEPGLSGSELAGFIIGGTGAAGIIAGIAFGLAATSDADVAHDLCDGNACRSRRGLDAAKRGNTMASVSTLSFTAGAVLLVGGASLLLFGPHGSEHPAQARQTTRSARATSVDAWADRSGFGVQLASTF